MAAQSARFNWSRFFKRLLIAMLMGLWFAFVLGMALGYGRPIFHHLQLVIWTISFSPYAIFIVILVTLWSVRPSSPAIDERKLQQAGEAQQRFRAFNLPVQALMLGVLTVLAARESALSGASPTAVLLWNCAVCLTIGLLMQINGVGYGRLMRATMDDELTRESRKKALSAGFFALLAVGALAYGLGLVAPTFSAYGLPATLFAGVATAAVRFALLERAADRDE